MDVNRCKRSFDMNIESRGGKKRTRTAYTNIPYYSTAYTQHQGKIIFPRK